MKLTSRNYYSKKANKEYMSVSQMKAFRKCPAAALAEIKGKYKRKDTTALLIGSYIDRYFEGTLDVFKQKYADAIFKRDWSLKSEFQQAEEIIKRISRDKLFMKFMSGSTQKIMTGTIEGVPFKIKIDSLHDDKIVDLKIMRDFQPIYAPEFGRLPWFEAWGYDVQGAAYQEIVRQNTGKRLPFYLAAATKEKVTDLEIVEIEQDLLDFELDRLRKDIVLFDAIKKGIVPAERCERCDFCKETKVLTKIMKSGDFTDGE